ncbi:hypothetical protein FRC12_024086 [Ceratobasidium sp. 428]|nr:hypothetical protein FRC12_024086 [Ceratobasidium sp. 428]
MPASLPSLPAPATASTNSHGSVFVSRKSSVSREDLVPAQNMPALRNGSLPPDMAQGSHNSCQSSVFSSSAQLSGPAVSQYRPPPPPPSASLRQASFDYDQVLFIKQMKYRFQFHLACEDAFPIHNLPVQEHLLRYAEMIMGGSRGEFRITQAAVDYVFKKESNIRNGFTHDLLKVVEEYYQVTPASGATIDSLVDNLNFAHVSFDPITKTVAGRYRHPCVGEVIKNMLFTRRSRGRLLGIRFIQELMGSCRVNDPAMLNAHPGAPVSLIACALTLIAHALQSIKAGDSSTRNKKTAKPLKLREGRYGGLFRTILAKLRQYTQLDKPRKEYMAMIMQAYLSSQANADGDSEDEIEFDEDEWQSDGE